MMWMMMGYNDAEEINTIQDPFTGPRLRPLMPRPTTATASTSFPCFTRIHTNDRLLGLNHHLAAAMVEQSERDVITTTAQVVVSSRWNPTPEQLQTLEELYRRGTRTPSAEQIQHITSQLRRYGKIEGKNVFYWFQNHKARERQKRRRRLESLSDENNNNNDRNQNEKGERREPPASNRTAFEVEQTCKNWASPTNDSTAAEKTTQGATRGADQAAERKSDGWVQLDAAAEILLQQGRNATCQMMHLSCSPSPSSSSSSPTTTNLIINCSSNNSADPSSTMQKQPHDFTNIIISEPYDRQNLDMSWLVAGREEAQTLQLFPLQSGGHGPDDEYMGKEEREEGSGAVMNPSSDVTTDYQFFEFLPIKN
ncbi:hypothetical protein OROGR_031143 [Orobanche gracilis]